MGIYADIFFKHIRPIKKPDLIQFSEKNIFLSKKISAETGRYNINRTPYLRDVMNALTDKETDVVVLMKSAQVGATQLGMNFLAYSILYDPAPILYVLPTLDIAKKVSKQRIQSLFDTTESLRGIVKDPRERDSGNTIFTKEFPNGILIIAGANSPAGLRSMPVRYLIADEIDAYPESAGDEGSPLDLALKRTMTFKNRKVFLISTPTNKGNSNIDYWYSISSQHKYYVPCPYCNHEQLLLFANLIFTHDENNNVTDVYYRCSNCGEKIYEKQKLSMLQKGKWISKNNKKDIKGFWINGLYSVWLTWREIAEEFLRVRHNTVALKTFVNTVLAEVWEDEAEKIDNIELSERRIDLSKIPSDCIVLTAGCDVQKDRIEVSIIGWGEGYTSWVIEHNIIYGDTTIEDTYKDLELALQRQYEGINNNIYSIVAACIDTGYATQAVYRFLKRNQSRRWWGIKGSATSSQIISRPSRRNIMNVPVYYLNVSMLKDIIFNRLNIKEGFGCVTFSDTLDAEYFLQLTAEQVKIRYHKGKKLREYVQIRERNEALDCMVYATAALMILNPNLNIIKNKKHVLNNTDEQATLKFDQNKKKQQIQRPNFKIRKGWMSL